MERGSHMTRTTQVLMALVVSLSLLVACQPALDRTPDEFSFGEVTGVEPSAVVTSDAITVAGIDTAVTIEVSGGDAVGLVNGTVVADGAAVVAGDEVQVRITASDQFSTTVTATVTIGGVSAEFSVTTRAALPDTTPDAFSFDPVAGAELSTAVDSSIVTVSGIDMATSASVSGDPSAVLIVNGGDVAGDVDVEAGDEVQVRLTSSANYGTAVTATVTIGGVSADFTVTTKASPVVPAIVSFDVDSAVVLWGDEDVTLSWTVAGDVTSLVLSNDYDDVEQDVTGSSGVMVTVPSDVASVTYTLTAASAELAASVSDDVVVGVELWVCSDPAVVVSFADPALEAALRFETALPESGDITCGDMRGLTEFFSGHYLVDGGPDVLGEIESLAGLQHAVNLEVLDLQVNLVRDVTPLANLPALEVLVLDLNPVEDLSPLADLTTLTTLSLWFLQERDVGAFPYDTEIYDLALCGTAGIDDIAPLSGLVNLTELYLSFNAVSDLTPLEGMTELEIAYLLCNAVESLAPLANAAGLQVLWAQGNAIGDTGIADLNALAALQYLRLDYNRVSDLSPLAALENLYAVDLEGNFLASVAPLADNLAFPELPAVVPSGWPDDPTLGLGYNCFDTTTDSPADLEVQAISGRGVTVVDFVEAFQREADECALFVPSSFGPFRFDPQDRPFGWSNR